MPHLRRVVLLALAGLATITGLRAQGPPANTDGARTGSSDGFLSVPPNVKAEGLPPIPASVVSEVAPYGSSRRALALAWHPTRREMLVTTAFDGNTFQFHSVAGPGLDRQQLTFFPTGAGVAANSVSASYAADGSSFVFTKD